MNGEGTGWSNAIWPENCALP